jgi:hypothetical protein
MAQLASRGGSSCLLGDAASLLTGHAPSLVTTFPGTMRSSEQIVIITGLRRGNETEKDHKKLKSLDTFRVVPVEHTSHTSDFFEFIHSITTHEKEIHFTISLL